MDENMKGAGGAPEEMAPSVSAAAEGGTTSQLSAEGGGSPVHDSGADTSVRVPKRGRAYDRSGSRVGKVRRGVWYDEDGKRLGEFVKEGDGVLYKDGGRSLGYVDANRNVFTHAGEYLATIRTAKVPLLFFLLLVLLFLALLTGVICSYFIGRSHEDAIPVIRIADTQGNDWAYTEDLPIFYNDYFNGTTVAPGMSGSYRFFIENCSDFPLAYTVSCSEVNDFGIRIRYRLTRDGYPITGEEYLPVGEMQWEDLTIETHSSAFFVLEWYWEDDDPVDTTAGENGATYTFTLSVSAWELDDGERA